MSLTSKPSAVASPSALITLCVIATSCATTNPLLHADAFQASPATGQSQSRKRPIPPSLLLLRMADGSPEETIDTKQISEPGDIYKYVDVEALEEEQRAKRRKKRLEEEAKRNKSKRDKKPTVPSPTPQADEGGQVKATASATAEEDIPKMEPHPPDEAPPIFVPRPYDPENPEAIFENARMFIESDLGLRSPNLLADDDGFVHITPKVDEIGPQNKKEYLAAGRFFDLRSTFPDLDYRAHHFRLVDDLDEEGVDSESKRQDNTTVSVRLTLRTTGTMTNALRLRKKRLPPTNATMICPPEAATITFDKKTGKITKLCSGFVMDRLVGNTDGLCGVQAAATIAGDQPSDWEVFPPPLVLSRIFGRPVQRLEEPKSLDAPFSEGVLISLAKGVIAADNGAKDPSVLAPSFSFCSPLVNPIGKKEFLDVLEGFDLKEAFPDLQTKFTNFRVDPFDPYRIWVDGLGIGTWTGPLMGKAGNGFRYKGPTEAISLTFNDEGLCTRLTAGVAMDPTEGNTGGLGGVFGFFYATNDVLPGFPSRPLPNLLARAAEKMSSKPTDDEDGPSKESEESKPQIDDSELNDEAIKVPGPEAVVKKTDGAQVPAPKFEFPKIGIPNIPSFKVGPPRPSQTEGVESAARKSEATREPASSEEFLARLKEDTEAKKAKAEEGILQLELEAKETRLREEAEKRAASIDTKRQVEDAKKKEMEERRRQTEDQRRAAEAISAAAKEKKQLERPVIKSSPSNNNNLFSNLFGASRSLKSSQEEAAKQTLAEDAADENLKQGVAKKNAGTKKKRDTTAKREENTPKKSPSAVKKRATTSLPGLFSFRSPSPAPTRSDAPPALVSSKPKPLITAPRGIPTLSKYRRNRDGSITAYIFNSSSFEDGKMITTSPVKTKVSPGSIVETSSGSKYLLDPGEDKILKEYQAKPKRSTFISQNKKKSAAIPIPSTETTRSRPKARATFSLFGLGEGQKMSQKQPDTMIQAVTKQPNKFNKSTNVSADAPPGIPKVIDWKQNFDGSISGFVTGASDKFVEGERIVTSPLRKGEVVKSESIVTTVSGSEYFLV